jgi:surface antigen
LAILRLVRATLLSGLLLLGQLPIGDTQGATPTSTNQASVDYNLPAVDSIFLDTPTRTVAFELVESEYQKKQREAEEERQRQLAEAAKKRAPVRVSVGGFYAGQCTAYVAARFPVTWRGNAIEWAAAARAQGYLVNKEPAPGAILQTTENSWGSKGAGHVAYIDAVVDGQMFISEQNYQGWGIVSKRTLPLDSPLIRAVIHRDMVR